MTLEKFTSDLSENLGEVGDITGGLISISIFPNLSHVGYV